VTLINRLGRAYPKGIGHHLAECEMRLRQRKYGPAQAACAEVLRGQSDNSWARYLLAVMESRQGHDAEAIAGLRDAISVDSRLEVAYQALAKLYRKTKDPRLAKLERAYRAHFGKALPK
jgi:predicted Zn-dependent protease